jgi:hypothetical protein
MCFCRHNRSLQKAAESKKIMPYSSTNVHCISDKVMLTAECSSVFMHNASGDTMRQHKKSQTFTFEEAGLTYNRYLDLFSRMIHLPHACSIF